MVSYMFKYFEDKVYNEFHNEIVDIFNGGDVAKYDKTNPTICNIIGVYNYHIKHYVDAITWWNLANDANSLDWLGMYYENIEKYDEKALVCYEQAISQGCARALYSVGLYYEKKGEYKKAVDYYKTALSQGCMKAGVNLGYYYKNINLTQAIYYTELSASNGCVSAMDMVGLLYETNGEPNKALSYYKMAIANGCNYAYEHLGLHYHTKDPVKAVEYYKLGASKGDVGSMFNLGVYYDGVSDNINMIKYYEMGVSNGCTKSMNNLGHYYYYDEKNVDKAIDYFIMAVQGEHYGALEQLRISSIEHPGLTFAKLDKLDNVNQTNMTWDDIVANPKCMLNCGTKLTANKYLSNLKRNMIKQFL